MPHCVAVHAVRVGDPCVAHVVHTKPNPCPSAYSGPANGAGCSGRSGAHARCSPLRRTFS